VINLALGKTRKLRKIGSHEDVADTVSKDIKGLIIRDGSELKFTWSEWEGAEWNDTYDVWEGGKKVERYWKLKGLGKVLSHKEDIMEYAWGRVAVGDCIVRFSLDDDISKLKEVDQLRFTFKDQKWRVDSPLGVKEYYGDTPYCFVIKGVKAVD